MAFVSLHVCIAVTSFLAVLIGVILNKTTIQPVAEYVDLQSCGPLVHSNVSGECFFRDSYTAARELFLRSAKDAGADMMYLRVTGDLGTDVAVLRGTGRASKRYLIHLSGVHGAEGYAGSAVQSAALQYLGQIRHEKKMKEGAIEQDKAEEVADMPTIVFVHAVNPYGFANNRRVNEANVDLNRNFLTEHEFATVRARDPNYAGYVDLDSLINPVKSISRNILVTDIYNGMRTAYAVGRYGLLHLKRALVSGNYHKQEGVGFGGFYMQPSAKNLITLVQGEWLGLHGTDGADGADQVMLIDVHTGLGPTGVDTLMSNPPSALNTMFPTEINYGSDNKNEKEMKNEKNEKKESIVTGGIHQGTGKENVDDALSGYDLTVGQTTSGFCEKWLSQKLSRDKVTCVIQEFGTVAPIVVGRNMIAENYAHFHGSESEIFLYKERYRDCFYVQTTGWKRKVLRRGLTVVLEAIRILGADSEKLPSIEFQL